MDYSRVTYIICNHNYGHYLEGCLKSAINQDYSPLQICIIDDGSNDNSWEIIESFFPDEEVIEQNGPNFILKSWTRNDGLRKLTAIKLDKKYGPSVARNVGIDATIHETDYYAILDADDENYPDKISKCIKILESDSNLGLVYADYHILNVDTGNILYEYKKPYDKQLLYRECIVHSGSVIRKEALEKAKDNTGYYDCNINCGEDWELWLRIADNYTMYHLAEPLSLVRVHQQDSTHSRSKEHWQKCWNYIREKTQQRHVR